MGNKGQAKPSSGPKNPIRSDHEEKEEEDKVICCCLCYAAVDYADKSYFCQQARDADSDLEGEQPMLLPIELYDPNNALVFCDCCDRPFHQRCHFVPVVPLPRGDWHCLICSSAPHLLKESGKKKKKKQATEPSTIIWTNEVLENTIFQMDKPFGILEQQWEHESRQFKVNAFKAQMKKLRSAISLQLQNIRLAQMALKAFTSSRRKTSVTSLLKSQELCQTLVKLTSAKLRVRQMLQSLETYMKGDDEAWGILQKFVHDNPSEVQAWFPFGQHPRRQVPRLQDDSNNKREDDVVPKEISIGGKPNASKQKNCDHSSKSSSKSKTKQKDDDSGISLDDLKCCVCFQGDATDENDLLLCDGQGCFRTYHMQCLSPVMTPERAEEEEDWFCPICTALAKFVADVQSEYTGDEWYDEEEGSVHSWDQVDDVFPEAPREHEMAINWKHNKLDDETKAFLTDLFGDDDNSGEDMGEACDIVGNDDYNEDEDGDFDPDEKEKADNEDVDESSNATLQDMSSVELKIGRQELDALSGGEDSNDCDEDEERDEAREEVGNKSARRSRRIRSAVSSRANTDDEDDSGLSSGRASDDIGRVDKSNIVKGKRRRRHIDYRLLNDSLFGKLSAKDELEIDDQDDFQYKEPSRRSLSSSSSDDGYDNDDDDSSDDEEDAEGSTSKEVSDDENSGKNEVKNKKTATRKRLSTVKVKVAPSAKRLRNAKAS